MSELQFPYDIVNFGFNKLTLKVKFGENLYYYVCIQKNGEKINVKVVRQRYHQTYAGPAPGYKTILVGSVNIRELKFETQYENIDRKEDRGAIRFALDLSWEMLRMPINILKYAKGFYYDWSKPEGC